MSVIEWNSNLSSHKKRSAPFHKSIINAHEGVTMRHLERNTMTYILEELPACCQQTIETHAAYNPMIVCQTCKSLLKCFKDGPAFNNYIRFCQSRGRPFKVTDTETYKIISLNSYILSFR